MTTTTARAAPADARGGNPASDYDVDRRVARGEAWLDDHRPGWLDVVDLTRLNMGDTDDCMLGQIFEPEGRARTWARRHRTGFDYAQRAYGERWAEDHGFDGVALDEAEYEALTRAWRELVLDRRAAS